MIRASSAGWVMGLLVTGIATSVSANMLSNGAMDDPVAFNDQEGWEAFSNSGDPNAAVAQADWANGGGLSLFDFWGVEGDGDLGLAFKTWQSTSGGFYQDAQIQSNKTYSFTIWSHTGCNAVPASFTNHERRIDFEWFDGDPDTGASLVAVVTNDITSQIVNGLCDDVGGPGDSFNWQYWEYTGITPPMGAEWIRIVIKWDSFGQTVGGGSEAIRWDSARLAVSSLDPLNESIAATTDFPVWYFDFFSQSNVNFALQYSTDLPGNVWVNAGVGLVPGNWEIQRVFDIPDEDAINWRIGGERE